MQGHSAATYVKLHIGPATGHILEVTQVGIHYIDEAHREHVLDFTDYKGKESPIVGSRVLDGGWSHPEEPPYYAVIKGKNLRVQFAFITYEEAYLQLLNSLYECGYQTVDLT